MPPDHELLFRLRADDVSALETLIDRHADAMRSVAQLVLGRTDTIDDIVQAVFVRLWERRAVLDVQGSLAGYLYRAVRNMALKDIRHTQAEARAYRVVTQSQTSVSQNTGAASLNAEEFSRVVAQTLDAMQPQVREVFLLRRFHEMPYEEIAETLGISAATARSQMSRAIRSLAEALRDWP